MRFLFPPRQHAPARPDDSASPDDQLLAPEPVLRSRQRPRLNHKALVFAATLLAGSAAMVAWSMNRLPWSDGGSAPMRSAGERVELPPQGFHASASAATAALLPDTLPPLPPPLPAASQSAPGMTAGSAMPIAMDNSALAPMDTAPVPLAPARPSRAALREPISPLSQADGPLVETVNAAAADSGGSAVHVQRVAHPTTLLPRGRVIRCVLETRIVSDLAGLTSCIVTEPVYSLGGQLLIRPGSRVSGQYQEQVGATERLAVVWERMLTPDGLDVQLMSPGADALGGTGHPGAVNKHWGERISSALLVSLMSDVMQIAAARHAPAAASPSTTSIGVDSGSIVQQSNPYQSRTADTLQSAAQTALQAGATRAPTITIAQGQLITIQVARDIDFAGVLTP